MRARAIDTRRSLRFATNVSATFDIYRWRRGAEAGGILLGRVYPSETVIEAVTTPTAADKTGRFFFDRSRTKAQGAVDTAWASTSGEQIYLGEWHSHPAEIAVPSPRDSNMILNMLRETRMEITFLFLVVLGREQDWVGIAQEGTLCRLHQWPPVQPLELEFGSPHPSASR